MKKNILFLVVGASGSGKTYIVDRICNQFNMKQVYSATTRKPRYEGEIGHIFVNREQAEKDWHNAVAKTRYNDELYYTTTDMLEDKSFYVIDPYGVRNFNYNIIYRPVKILFINSPWYIRMINMFKRGDKLKDIINRLLLDKKEFKGFKGDLEFKNSNDLYDYFEQKHLMKSIFKITEGQNKWI